MLTGLSGFLVSEGFLEQQIATFSTRRGAAIGDRLAVWHAGCASLGPASSLRSMLEAAAGPFVRHLGFGTARQITWYEDAAAATLDAGTAVIALVVTRWGERLDGLWRLAIVEGRKRTATWCLVFNGSHVRLVDVERVYIRRYLQFDLGLSLEDARTRAVLSSVLHADRFSGPAGGGEDLRSLIARSEQHAAGVCRSLRRGVLDASREILSTLVSRQPGGNAVSSYEQALTVVYRILFLLFAEGRALVPLWHPVYRDSYSLESLCACAVRGDASIVGLWDGLQAVSRLAHGGCHAGTLRMTAFNGRLFAPARTPLASQRGLDDRALGRALCALSTRPADGGGLERITYRDLGVEQLGAVYETVLDYRPLLNRAARAPRGETAVSLEPGSGRRKTTATFYTPRPLAEYLARRTLGPLVDGQPPARILEIKVLDPAMGSGACLVAACGVLAQAYEAALVATGSCHPSDLGPVERAGIRRTIAERCLFGVDVNPTAVELARLSIWLTTLAADRPLSFLDHHLRAGDSILGTWLTLLRRPPAPGRRGPAGPMPLLDEDRLTDTLQHALPLRFALAETPNETIEQVRQKERTLAELEQPDSGLSRWKRVADLWCSSWFGQTAAAFHALSDHILTGTSALPLTTIARCLKAAGITAQARRFFHWELEFPEVFFEAGGAPRIAPGFDAVLGNPPWRMGRGDRMLTTALGFCRQSGVYEAPSEGQANLYQVFVERAVRLTRRGGRLGLVLPSGFASDVGSTPLRRLLFSHTSVDTLLGIDNRRGIFPIHRSVRILLVTATNGPKTRDFECRLGARDLTAIEPDPHGARPPLPVRLTPELLERVSGASLAVPDVRSAIDLVILERAASLFRPLGEPTGWGARFGRDLNATDDRRHLRAAGGGLPVLEGKHLEPFRARVDAAKWRVTSEDARHLLGSRTDRPRLAYRDVASATNRQTLIAALLPAGCASTHTIFCLRTPLSRIEQHFLCAFFNSFVVNYLVRCRVSTHVTTGVVEHLPIPTRVEAGAAFGEIAGLARLLSRGPRPSALAQMNAQVAELYQLTRVEFAHVLDTFPLVEQAERDAALCALTG